jgi:hypothetical protein
MVVVEMLIRVAANIEDAAFPAETTGTQNARKGRLQIQKL